MIARSRKKKFRRRRMSAIVLLAVVMIWIAGCAASETIGLSALLPSKEKEIHIQGEHALGNGGQQEGETEGTTAGFIPGANSGTQNKPGSSGEGGD